MSPLHQRIANDQWLARAIILLVIAAVLVAGLIEFSQRRSAAAIARELARLPADNAQAALPGAAATVLAPQPAVLDRTNADHDIDYLPGAFDGENRPLAPGERCIQGLLFRRIPGGWEQIVGRKCAS
ncbi:MAG: hypothetical protein DI635_05055 [Pseudoxanthomonas suwonensis]|nr:MAG: hypothetical protein DI635_05055 [Pseudoxanthomonas suwonensis]